MHAHLTITISVLAALSGVLWVLAPAYRSRMHANWLLLGVALALELAPNHPLWVGDLSAAFAEVVAIRVAAILIFRIVLHRTGWPVILTDVAIVGGYAIALINLLVEVGVNVSGLLATSALLAGIVGLALQEVLGNLIGGAAIHADGAIREGVWIKTEHGTGRVTNVRLRHTSIETADSNVIIIPNSSLTKGAVTIISSRQRLILRFQLPAAHRPTTVVRLVEEALSSPLHDVAREPAPRCFIAEFQAQHIEYAVHVWVTSPGREEVPVSLVLARVFFVLARAGAPVASVPNAVELHTADAGHERQSRESAFGLLKHIPIWSRLTEGEMSHLASRLKWVVHGPGEAIVRQGDEGESMFVLLRGSVAVSLTDTHGRSEQVATLGGGDFFGEMSLMTGEKRSASVTALEEVECAELHKDDVAGLLLERPELAREISAILEQRQGGLASAREKFQNTPRTPKPRDLLGRIQQYFSIDRGLAGVNEPPSG